MPYSDAQTSFKSTTTLCCKTVYFSLLSHTLLSGTTELGAITSYIDAVPLDSIIVNLTVALVNNTVMTTPASITPIQIVYTNASVANSLRTLALTAGNAGTYAVSATVTGASADEYSVSFTGPTTFTVIGIDEEPPVPAFWSASFSSDGLSVLLTFDSATDSAGYSNRFPCSALLEFPGMMTAECRWADDQSIEIIPIYHPSAPDDILVVGSSISVASSGTIRAQCTWSNAAGCEGWAVVSGEVITVSSPASAIEPIISVTAPTSIGICSDLTIDLTAAVGAAGRPWRSMQFTVTSPTATDANLATLQRFLDSNFTVSPPVPIPAELLDDDTAYVFTFRLCNFLGSCGVSDAPVRVQASSADVSITALVGMNSRTIVRSRELKVQSTSFIQSCDGGVSSSGLQFSWSIEASAVLDNSVEDIALPSSVSQNPAIFKVPPYSLTANVEYSIRLTVTTSTSPVLSSATEAIVIVEAADLVAILSGGSNRALKIGEIMTIDASRSYDEDTPDATGLVAGLAFSWSCVQLLPQFSATCSLTMPSNVEATTATELFDVTADYTASNTTSRVTVVVYNAARSATAFTDIAVSEVAQPQLDITSKMNSLRSINTNKRLSLTGKLILSAPCTASWIIDDSTVSLSSALTPLTSELGVGSHLFSLQLPANLLPQRATLAFSLYCDNTRTSITVTTNGAPIPGAFSVSPSSGEGLTTEFLFLASEWTDVDIPLTYQIGFYSSNSDSTLITFARSELSYGKSALPSGLPDFNYEVKCSLQVYDAVGAETKSSAKVTVTPSASGNIESIVSNLIDKAGDSVDDSKRLISVGSSALNSVDCSQAPNCTALNREQCSSTVNTCGKCLAGYIGDTGVSNNLCVRALVVQESSAVAGCISNTDCKEWQRCEETGSVSLPRRTCVAAPKACSNNCTINGDCEFNLVSTGATVAECRLDDSSCEARCVCRGDYFGSACQLDGTSTALQNAARAALIARLTVLVQNEDVNEESVASWADSLYSLTLNPYALTAENVKKVQSIALVVITSAQQLDIEDADSVASVVDAIDLLASVDTSAYYVLPTGDIEIAAESNLVDRFSLQCPPLTSPAHSQSWCLIQWSPGNQILSTYSITSAFHHRLLIQLVLGQLTP